MRVLVRILLAIISLLYSCVGGFLVIIGSIYGAAKFHPWTSSELNITALLLLILGIVVLVLGLTGLGTSCARSFGLSYSLAFILFFAIIIQGVLAILIVFFRPEIEKFLVLSFQQTMSSYNDDGNGSLYANSISRIWDATQSTLGCCGVVSFTDWSAVPYGQTNRVPASCCTRQTINSGNTLNGGTTVENPNCGQGIQWAGLNPTIYQNGCGQYVGQVTSDYLGVVLGVAAGILVLQILGVCFACCLGRSVQMEECRIYDG